MTSEDADGNIKLAKMQLNIRNITFKIIRRTRDPVHLHNLLLEPLKHANQLAPALAVL